MDTQSLSQSVGLSHATLHPTPLPTRVSASSRNCGNGEFSVTRNQGSTGPNPALRRDLITAGYALEHHDKLSPDSATGPEQMKAEHKGEQAGDESWAPQGEFPEPGL